MAEEQNHTSWKANTLLIGTLLGALVGLGTAYLLARTAEDLQEGPPKINTTEALRAGISVIGVMRGIASLADRKK